MNNSPYIQAYEAGIKLAVAQHFGKVAKDGDTPQITEEDKVKLDADAKARNDRRVAANDTIDATMPGFAANYPRRDGGGAATTPSDDSSFLDNLGSNLTSTRDAIRRGLSSAGNAISSSIPTADQASNFLEGAGDFASGAGGSLMAGLTQAGRNVSDYFNQEAPAPKQPVPAKREGKLPEVNFNPNRSSKYKMEDGPNTTAEGTFKSDFGDNDPTMGVYSRGSVTTPKQPDPPAQSQRFGRPSMTRDANRSFNLGGDLSLNMDNFALPTPQAPQAQPTENTGPGILSREYRDQNDTLELADARLTDIEQQNTPTMLRGIPQPQASRRAPAPQPPQAQAPSPRFTEDDRLAINQQNAMAGMEPLRAEPSELARIPNFPSISDRRALNQATAQKAQDRRDEAEMDGLLEDDAARGNVEDDQTFGAVRGGYGKQLRALRGMGGLSEDARDLLGQTNYRQLASAMGDRGLRVGDQFNVQDLLGRLRGQQARRDQEAGGGGAIGSTVAPIQIQNRRGRDVSRGAMAPRPNVQSMVNQLGIAPSESFNLGPAPSQEELLRSVGANPSTRRSR